MVVGAPVVVKGEIKLNWKICSVSQVAKTLDSHSRDRVSTTLPSTITLNIGIHFFDSAEHHCKNCSWNMRNKLRRSEAPLLRDA